jgi:Peptidase family M3
VTDPAARLADLNADYCRLHVAKEDAFWTKMMGLADDAAQAGVEFERHELALARFLQDADRLAAVRAAREAADATGAAEDVRVGLTGWERTLEAHAIDSAEGRALFEEIVAAEGELGRSRGGMQLGYRDPDSGEAVRASSIKLRTMIDNDPDQARRKAAWEGMRSIEEHVLSHGFLDLVRRRNRLARSLGADDFYDWVVRRNEGWGKAEVFALLDELEGQTRDTARRGLEQLRGQANGLPLEPWNVGYLSRGDVTRAQDPYFPFQAAVERWGRSFAALGIDYRGAVMRLDLLDRQGKYENGFMHGPEVSWRDAGTHHRARIQFTANAIPGAVGSGATATRTLFHEGGHAAHFANVDMPAPCFGQEFAPTSPAFAEVQSMTLDSLLADADWQQRYARTLSGDAMPWELVEAGIAARQPQAAWSARAMLAVCYGEKEIYELPDDELTPERVLKLLRDVERRLLFLDNGSPRPVLSVPHLLAGESSAYYHAYTLALMGVHQTRACFMERDGHLMDNPRVGPSMRDAYWRPGNSRRTSDLIAGLTGDPLGAAAYAEHVNRTVDEALAGARAARDRSQEVPAFEGEVDLNASVEIVHGHELVASNAERGFAGLAADFSAWIAARGEG